MVQKSSYSLVGTIGALWGVAGIVMLLGSAAIRLAPVAAAGFLFHFSFFHWTFLLFIVAGMAYAEGYHGFQKRFSPRAAARARYLRANPRVVWVCFAPLFCMGYFHATRRRKITSVFLTLGIIILIILVRLIEQPWRGIIDAGVVVGLLWGIASLLVFSLQALLSDEYAYSAEVPEER